MGVVNVTPDSFSDGGRWADARRGGRPRRARWSPTAPTSSTWAASPPARVPPGRWRPRSSPGCVPVIERARRRRRGRLGRHDARRGRRARRSGWCPHRQRRLRRPGRPGMLRVVAGSDATYVAMHWRAHADRMQDFASYDGRRRRRVGPRRARPPGRRDRGRGHRPGPGGPRPGARLRQDGRARLGAARGLDVLHGLGLPLLVGASRKSFLGPLLGSPGRCVRSTDRDHADAALTTWLAATDRVWGIRVHDVRSSRDALAVWPAMARPDGRT